MDWRDLARHQAGVITRDQLADCSLSLSVIRRLVAQRELVTLLPGVYAARPVPDSFEQRAWAAALWSGGVISHRSAAYLWDLPVPGTACVHLIVDPGQRRTAPGLVLHRVALPPRSMTTINGLPVTTRRSTVLDLLRTESAPVARSLLDRSIQQRWLEPEDLQRAVVNQPGRAGNRRLRVLVGDIEPGADAKSERILHRRLRAAKITGWVPQYRVQLSSSVVYLDLAFPELGVAIEVDGRRYHDERSDAFESDRRKQNELQLRGWLVLRFTWAALRDDPGGVIAMIAATLHERSRQSGAL